jgi:hypothetical protein
MIKDQPAQRKQESNYGRTLSQARPQWRRETSGSPFLHQRAATRVWLAAGRQETGEAGTRERSLKAAPTVQ